MTRNSPDVEISIAGGVRKMARAYPLGLIFFFFFFFFFLYIYHIFIVTVQELGCSASYGIN